MPAAEICLVLWASLAAVSFVGCGRRPPPLAPAPPTSQEALEPVTVSKDSAPLPPQLEVQIEPAVIQKGESSLLVWESKHADLVQIDHRIGQVENSGKIKFFPEQTTTYRIVAEGVGGKIEQTVTVKVLELKVTQLPDQEQNHRSFSEQFHLLVKPVFFEFDNAELGPEAGRTLHANILWLNRPENMGLKFLIQGYCDERGTEEYNLALGDKRAQTVRAYLIANGIDPSRISIVSLGEERPFDSSQTEKAWALNRRAHFMMLP